MSKSKTASKNKSAKARKPKASPAATDRKRKQAVKEIGQTIAQIDAAEKGPEPVTALASTDRPAKVRGAKQAKSPGELVAPGRLSCLDAAAQVIAETSVPLKIGQIYEQIVAKGLWTSPSGKTPAATLNAAIIREIKNRGPASRFKKVDRGLFAAA